MRKIDKIILHCSATREGQDIKAETIRKWHVNQGWNDIGYHFVIDLDGTIEIGRDLDKVGAHTSGYNATSIGICYIGGLDENGKVKDTRTPKQIDNLAYLCKFMLTLFPKAKISGHNQYAAKACPCFDVEKFCSEYGLPFDSVKK